MGNGAGSGPPKTEVDHVYSYRLALLSGPRRRSAVHEGAVDAVRIVDQTGLSAAGCIPHGAVLLASLDGDRCTC
jgi:hypothetical protein